MLGEALWGSNNRFHQTAMKIEPLACGTLICDSGVIPLRSGRYNLSVWIGDWNHDFDKRLDCIAFEILDRDENKLMPSPNSIGYLNCKATWSSEALS
jgi:lipopolysaccharide transport system ATP-binding protein